MEKTCSFDGCERPFLAKGYCHPHYNQTRSGRPLTPVQYRTPRSEIRRTETHRTCNACRRFLPLAEFPLERLGADGTRGTCKECRNAARAATRGDPVKGAAEAAQRKKKMDAFKEWLWGLKSEPCTDCKSTYHPVMMQFDHLPGTARLFDVSTTAWGRSRKSVIEEMAKCELVCANCHAYRTWSRKQH